VPADHRWYRNYAVTRLLIEALERLPLQLPKPAFDAQELKRRLS